MYVVSFIDKARNAAASLWRRGKPSPARAGSTNWIDEGARISVEGAASRPPRSNQDSKVDRLLDRGDGDARRMDLDRIDENARATNTWGSSEHHKARDQREGEHAARRREYETLSEEEMDQLLSSDEPE